eukprot:NODE_11049_length_566_cov_18.652370_g10769_i0.p1 GENE.NODE_11049_length_566_cov_18.652370_g10769_i0~~NODE_11049_length_566_cov_18.652370_g10769_i0.p1  ORF type:complete len:173 (+),score=48.12 NODE_11049_length_566_cov_18.652370_g10769_i0:59-520(+)
MFARVLASKATMVPRFARVAVQARAFRIVAPTMRPSVHTTQMRRYADSKGVIAVATEQEFRDLIDNNKFVAIDFFADWCGPCKQIAPVFQKLSTEFPEITFVKVDCEALPQVAGAFGISSIPHFTFVKDRTEVNKLIGADKGALKRMLQELKE